MINFNDVFDYDCGTITYKVAPRRKPWLHGCEAGTKRGDGYVIVKINGKRYYRHRIVWCMFNGDVPDGMVIDHDNGVPGDDRIENLRLKTVSGNARNSKMNIANKSGFNGVSLYRNGKWRAFSKGVHIGYFDSFDDAVKARERFNKDNGFTERHGK